MDIHDKLAECLSTLEEITESGYWPFASPAPSSTEVKIKKGITGAISLLDEALYWHDKMFTQAKRDPMAVASFTIKKVK